MRTTEYLKLEREIAAADRGGIRARWLWGLRLYRDPNAMSSPKSLRHGVTEELIAAAQEAGLTLSATEIRYRLQCARSYPRETQIGQVLADFKTWHDLIEAAFPAYEAPEGEPLAEHRTDAERRHDKARALMENIGSQVRLFPARHFEPGITTLTELADYTDEQDKLTARFVEHGRKRRTYLEALIKAAGGDLGVFWQQAQKQLDDGNRADLDYEAAA